MQESLKEPSPQLPSQAHKPYQIVEERVCPYFNFWEDGRLGFSPDGRRYAYAAVAGAGKSRLIVDGAEGPECDEIHGGILSPAVFSQDSEHVACAARNGSKWLLLVDGQAGPTYDAIGPLSKHIFSPDGRHCAYAARKGDRWVVVKDGLEGAEHDEIKLPSLHLWFSPDSRRFGYVAREGNKRVAVIDGKLGERFDDISALVFSRNGNHVAYLATRAAKQLVVIDDVAGPACDKVHWFPRFSADGQHVAYVATVQGRESVVFDGQVGLGYHRIGRKLGPGLETELILSPDGGRMAYVAWNGRGFIAVIDETPGPEYACITGLAFSRCGRHVAYTAQKGNNKWVVVRDGQPSSEYDHVGFAAFSPATAALAYCAQEGETGFLVFDNVAGPKYAGAVSLTFSRDGQHLAYVASAGEKMFVVLDGQPGPQYDGVAGYSTGGQSHPAYRAGGMVYRPGMNPFFWYNNVPGLTFSLDSKRLAYVAQKGAKDLVVVDGHPGPECDGVYALAFSPDGRRVAYAAGKGRKQFDYVTRLTFGSDGRSVVRGGGRCDRWCVVVDDQIGPLYDEIAKGDVFIPRPVFSQDSKHVAYKACRRGKHVVVADGQEGPAHDWIVPSVLGFFPDGSIEYLAADRDSEEKWVYRVRHVPGI